MLSPNLLGIKAQKTIPSYTEDRENKVTMKYSTNKLSLKQFGASKIFVINQYSNKERREAFKEDWSHFSDFDFEFSDATTGPDININNLISSSRLETFWCGEGALTENILGCYESHREVWKKIVAEEPCNREDYFLIMEDDARLTPYFAQEAVLNGQFLKTLKFVRNTTCNIFWWGKSDNRVIGKPLNKIITIPDNYLSYGAHAYMVSKSFAKYLLSRSDKIEYPVDILIDLCALELGKTYAPNFSFIRQVQHMEDTRFLVDDHPLKMWASTTQPDRKSGNDKLRPYPYHNIPDRILPYVESVEDHMLNNRKDGLMLKLKEHTPKQLL